MATFDEEGGKLGGKGQRSKKKEEREEENEVKKNKRKHSGEIRDEGEDGISPKSSSIT